MYRPKDHSSLVQTSTFIISKKQMSNWVMKEGKEERSNEGKRKWKRRQKQQSLERKNSLGNYSSDTNETDSKVEQTEIDLEKIFQDKAEEDFINFFNKIFWQGNLYYERRCLAFDRILAILSCYQLPVKLYGSCANGIATKTSDLDIAIDGKILSYYEQIPNIQDRIIQALKFLANLFKSLPWIRYVNFISTAKIPIIKLVLDTRVDVLEQFIPFELQENLNRKITEGGQVSIDLTIETTLEHTSQNHVALHLGVISTQMVNYWFEIIPVLRPITLVLKHFISKAQLNNTHKKGLNTYALIVMLVAFISYSGLQQETNYSSVFEKIIKFYGREFNEKLYRINLAEQKIFIPKMASTKFAPLQVCDPTANNQICTKNCYKYQEIKSLFNSIHEKYYSNRRKQFDKLVLQNQKEENFISLIKQQMKDNYFIVS